MTSSNARSFLCLLLFFSTGLLVAQKQSAETSTETLPDSGDISYIAEVSKVSGMAYLHKPSGLRALPVKTGMQLFPEDTVSTTASGKVVLRLFDDSTVVLDGLTRMRFRSPNEFYHERGVAYFDILSRQNAQRARLNIRTDFAIAGVKGTEFIINAHPYSPAISLNEGELQIHNPNEEPYELVRRRAPSGFDDYQSRRMSEFEQWKSQLIEEFVGYKKSFTMESGKQILFNGQKAVEESFSDKIQKSFEDYRALR